MGGIGSHYKRDETQEPFKVIIHRGELAQIEQWVNRHQEIETGGDLFGLWSKGNTAVVQIALGPGRGSGRTAVSFFQNAEYLQKAGSHLTKQYGLCHIGEWHSHHSLGLAKPSGGDQNTVWSNMPNNGFKRFIVFIANIDKETPSRKQYQLPNLAVGLGCFLFEAKDTVNWEYYPMMQGLFVVIDGQSPYRKLKSLSDAISNGAETINQNSEVDFEPVGSGTTRCEGKNILLYSKEKSTGQWRHPAKLTKVASTPYTTDYPKQISSSVENGTSIERQARVQGDGREQPPFTVTVDSLMHTNVGSLWGNLDKQKQIFFERLSRELVGQLVKEINTVSIQFVVRITDRSDLACTLVYDEEALLLYRAMLPSLSCEIKLENEISAQSIDSQVQFVKDEVEKHIIECLGQLASCSPQTTPGTLPSEAQEQQQTSGPHPSATASTVADSAVHSSQPAGISSQSNDPRQGTTNLTGSSPAYQEEDGSSSSEPSPMDIDEGQPHVGPLAGHPSHFQTEQPEESGQHHYQGVQGYISQSHSPAGPTPTAGLPSWSNATSQQGSGCSYQNDASHHQQPGSSV